jgi:hypothetical protein
MEKASARDSAVPATLKTAENDDEDEDEEDWKGGMSVGA